MKYQHKNIYSIINKEGKIIVKLFYFLFLCSQSHFISANSQTKQVLYRYYDQNGIANISTNVTHNHLQYGYETINTNMQVIQKNKPYTIEKDLQQAHQHAIQSQQQESDLKLKRAYTNSKIATQKKNAELLSIKKQMSFQQEQLKQLQQDRVIFKRKEMEYIRTGKQIPENLQLNIKNNLKNIINLKETIQNFQINYINTENHYNEIIMKLKKME